jgi:hypothetical protein
MSAVLRASGRDFDVDAFLGTSALKPCRVYHRGDPRFPHSPPGGKQFEKSGMHVAASATQFVHLPKQVAEATAFLLAGSDEIRRLVAFPGVEGVTLDFGIERRDVAVQCDVLPAELIRVAGSLGLSIELSQYRLGDKCDEERAG